MRMWRKVMAEKRISVKFGGQIDQVDVNTFTRVLLDYSTVAQAAGREVDPNASLNANVTAVRPGCLTVDLSIVADGIGGLFRDPETSIQTLSAVVTIVGGFYGFKKFLGKHGKPVKSEDAGEQGVRVTAADGHTTLVNNGTINLYMGSEAANKAVNSSFSSLENDPRIQDIEIRDGDTPLFRATQDEFPQIASSPSYEGAETRHQTEETELTVIKPVLARSSKRKWEFIWRGVKMSANITDRAFIDNRLMEEPFYVGTIMSVTLDITQRYDPDARAFLNVGYEVKRVGDVKRPPKEQNLF